MTFGSLFAGIGGADLGFERAGMECRWQVEIDTFCRRVLAKHWPDVRRHDDIRTFPPAGDWQVDVIVGGDPCQGNSNAGSVWKKQHEDLGSPSRPDALWPWWRMRSALAGLGYMLSCPSDSDPVALGLSISGTACGCSLIVPTPTASQTPVKDVGRLLERRAKYREKYGNNGFGLTLAQWLAVRLYPTPVASDFRGSTGKGSRKGTLAERAAVEAGIAGRTVYPHPEFVEAVMRFPASWTELEPSETASTRSSRSSSDGD